MFINAVGRLAKCIVTDLKGFAIEVSRIPSSVNGRRFTESLLSFAGSDTQNPVGAKPWLKESSLLRYFREHEEGPGIWKWEHYFEIYDRYLSKFVGENVSIMEIGIYSGGSLGMWKEYFGPQARIYGIDIEPACKSYEEDQIEIIIGDQESRSFWEDTRKAIPKLDILIDDGGHTPEQQTVTLEEVLPFLESGGVYICEDVVGQHNRFGAYITGLINNLNTFNVQSDRTFLPTSFQEQIYAIHQYPLATVIEKTTFPVGCFEGPRKGTEWQPFKF